MAAFLSGLLRNPQLGDEEDAYALTGGAPMQPQAAPQPPKADRSPGGLLKQAADWALSPQGLLAIGTTLRAGGGDPNAFGDQRAIMSRWDARRKEDETNEELDRKNKALNEGFITDEKTGKTRYDLTAHRAAMKKYGVKSDMGTTLKEAKELQDKYQLVEGPTGLMRVPVDPGVGDPEMLKNYPYAIDPDKENFLPTDMVGAPPGSSAQAGAPAVAASPVAAAGASVPPPPPPPDPNGPDEQQVGTPAELYGPAIHGIESRGQGNYTALGPVVKNGMYAGDRAYGRYQVMGKNVADWTREALGQAMTPEDFLASPEAQDAVFNHRFGGYIKKYGSPEEAASVWFTGRPLGKGGAGARDQLGTTGASYAQRFSQGVAAQPGATPQVRPTGAPAAPLVGSDAGDQIAAPPGYQRVAPRSKIEWEVLSPEASAEIGPGRYKRNIRTGDVEQITGTGPKGGGAGRVPAAVLNQQGEHVSSMQTIGGANATIQNMIDQIDAGTLKFNALEGARTATMLTVGAGDERADNYESFNNNIESLRNAILIGAKGVQTEGDAVRALNQIMSRKNDQSYVRRRLEEIRDNNTRNYSLHKDYIGQIRGDAGLDPYDFTKLDTTTLPQRGGGKKDRPPLSSFEK